ncbi:endolytic transglycosylase MltG [Microbacterium murale]|uniref:Endolytic murein transglycosylase n=1 Tax=Microbacterium murale TaxID=1081040 RepID=A0ABQ1RSS6_9MICO|nr:endolytic transglycosylase MltG [Microbacterium murale]GGD78352.1 ABC transporter substrate-binding protein [Microbacterium murale]
MPERESPERRSNSLSDDLFSKLPAPGHQVPTADTAPPAPGSRRALREAAQSETAPSKQARSEQALSEKVRSAAAERETAQPHEAAESMSDDPAENDSPFDEAADPATRPVTTSSPASLDDLFAAEHDDADGSAPHKKKRRTGCLVALIIVLALIGGAVAGGAWAWNTYGDKISEVMGWGEPDDYEAGIASGEALVTIHEGDTGSPVSTALHEAGVTKTESVFYDYLVKENIAVTFYPGVYKLQQKMTAEAALEALQDESNKLENSVGISEGGTLESSLPVITESIGIPLEDLQAAVADPSAYGVASDSLEGWLFPAVYTFDPEATATQVIQRMVDRTRESLTAAGVPAGDEQRILTIASIIQREGRTDDFAKVSRVIQNRLDDGMKLQMDSTAQYGYGELHAGVVSTSSEAQNDDNPWNTYVREGLPAGPIANPNDAAIEAAMHPADGPWLYFVTINLQTGETVFSNTYEEHQAAIKTWQEWCSANPDQGC